MAFEWMMKLNDMVSDPATRIARKLHDVNQQLLAIDYAVKRRNVALMNPGIKKDIAALEAQRLKLKLLGGEINNHDRVSSSLVANYKHLRTAARDWLIILTPLAMGLRFVYGQAKQLAHEIIGPIRAVEEASLGMKTMYGGKVGDQLLQMVQELGPRVGRPIAEMFKEATKLGVAGAPAEMMRPMLLALSDMKAMGKDTTQLEYILQSAWSRPVASIHEMVRGMSRVVNETLVWKQLAKDMGVSIGDLNWMISKNLIGGGALSTAVLEVIQAMEGGKLGKTAFARADSTLGGMIDRLSARMEKLIMGITGTKGFGTLKLVMKNLIDVLGSKDTKALVTDLANSIGKMLEPLTGEKGRKDMISFFTAMETMIKKVLPLLSLFSRVVFETARFFSGATWGNTPGAGGVDEFISNPRAWAIHKDLETQNFMYPMGDAEARVLPTLQKGRPQAPAVIFNSTMNVMSAGSKETIPDETKQEMLQNLSDAIDKINLEQGLVPSPFGG